MPLYGWIHVFDMMHNLKFSYFWESFSFCLCFKDIITDGKKYWLERHYISTRPLCLPCLHEQHCSALGEKFEEEILINENRLIVNLWSSTAVGPETGRPNQTTLQVEKIKVLLLPLWCTICCRLGSTFPPHDASSSISYCFSLFLPFFTLSSSLAGAGALASLVVALLPPFLLLLLLPLSPFIFSISLPSPLPPPSLFSYSSSLAAFSSYISSSSSSRSFSPPLPQDLLPPTSCLIFSRQSSSSSNSVRISCLIWINLQMID